MLEKTRAIVLNQIKYGESGLIVNLYSENYGRMTCMVNGARTKKTKISPALFQPLNLLEIDFFYRQGRGIQRLKEAEWAYQYSTVPFTITKSSIALFIAEVCYITLREEAGNKELFSFLFHAFQLLDNQDNGIANFHLWFLLHFTRPLGFFPVDSALTDNDNAIPEQLVLCNMPSGDWPMLNLLLKSPQGLPKEIPITKQIRASLLEVLIRYYDLHIEGFSKIKSLPVMQEVFK